MLNALHELFSVIIVFGEGGWKRNISWPHLVRQQNCIIFFRFESVMSHLVWRRRVQHISFSLHYEFIYFINRQGMKTINNNEYSFWISLHSITSSSRIYCLCNGRSIIEWRCRSRPQPVRRWYLQGVCVCQWNSTYFRVYVCLFIARRAEQMKQQQKKHTIGWCVLCTHSGHCRAKYVDIYFPLRWLAAWDLCSCHKSCCFFIAQNILLLLFMNDRPIFSAL